MQNITATPAPRLKSPRLKSPSYEEIERSIYAGRALRSAAAFAFFSGIAGGIARVFNGLRHRETTHWPVSNLRQHPHAG